MTVTVSSLFFLGNTNFGLDGEFLASLCGFKQVAICSSYAGSLVIFVQLKLFLAFAVGAVLTAEGRAHLAF